MVLVRVYYIYCSCVSSFYFFEGVLVVFPFQLPLNVNRTWARTHGLQSRDIFSSGVLRIYEMKRRYKSKGCNTKVFRDKNWEGRENEVVEEFPRLTGNRCFLPFYIYYLFLY